MVRIIENTLFNGGKAFIRAAGLSTDTKPTGNIITGSKFYEVNTGAEFAYDEDGEQWDQVGLTSADMIEAIGDWLDDHPEATTTVEDGAITKAKLDSDLQETVDEVSDLKSAIGNVEIDNMTFLLSVGSYKAATGQTNTDNAYCRTNVKIPDYVSRIEAASGYVLRLLAWHKDTGVYTGILLDTGVIAPLPTGGHGMLLTKIDMDTWRTAYPNNRFEIVITNETGSAEMTVSEAKTAFKAYANSIYIKPEKVNGVTKIYADTVKGTFANPHDTAKNAVLSTLIPVNERSLITFHASYIPAALTAGKKFYRYWEFRTFDATGTVVRSTSITRNSISNRCFIQPGEKYIQINHGVGTLDGTSSATVVNVLPSDCAYGQFWIEVANGIDEDGFRSIQSANVLGIAHKGVSNIAPEETEPAYILAKKLGFTVADGDLVLAGDGTPVLMHDLTINRTGRNADGTAISSTTRVDSLTLTQLRTYDFGVWKGSAFAGTKILSLDEFLAMCKRIGMVPSIEIKQTVTFADSDLDTIIGLIKKYGMEETVRINSGDVSYLTYVATELPHAAEYSILTQTITDTDIDNAEALKAIADNVMIGANYSNVTDALANKCIAAGIPLRVWTVDDPIPLGYTLNGYVSAVVSNTVNASQWLEEYNMSHFK